MNAFCSSVSFIFLVLVFTKPAYSQAPDSVSKKDIVDVIIKTFDLEKKEAKRAEKKVRFSVIPVASASSGGKQLLVSSVSATFHLGSHETTNLSNIFLLPYLDFKGSGGVIIRPNLWTDGNKWNMTGEFRLTQIYQYTYGLGANTSDDAQTTVKYNQLRLYSIFNRSIIRNFFVGGGFDLDYYYSIQEQNPGIEDSSFKKYGIGTSGRSSSSGLVVDLLRDSRPNSINAEDGFYTALIFKIQDQNLGSDYSWSSLYFDARKYFSFHEERHRVLALWVLYWGTYGDTPYLNLPGTAMEFGSRSGRGYSIGRYRGKQMLYGETEYRFDITSNGLFGGVIFANAQSYTALESEKFEDIKIGAGVGLRLKFDKKTNTNLTLDFGFGKDSFNVRVNLGEFF